MTKPGSSKTSFELSTSCSLFISLQWLNSSSSSGIITTFHCDTLEAVASSSPLSSSSFINIKQGHLGTWVYSVTKHRCATVFSTKALFQQQNLAHTLTCPERAYKSYSKYFFLGQVSGSHHLVKGFYNVDFHCAPTWLGFWIWLIGTREGITECIITRVHHNYIFLPTKILHTPTCPSGHI